MRRFIVGAVSRKFRFSVCLILPLPFLAPRMCTRELLQSILLEEFVVHAGYCKFRFCVVLEPSLSLLPPTNCTREFMQFILLGEFVVPRKFRFYGVLEPSLPCFFLFGHVSSFCFILLVEFAVRLLSSKFSLWRVLILTFLSIYAQVFVRFYFAI